MTGGGIRGGFGRVLVVGQVALTLVLALGKLWLGLLSLVPNLLPPLVAFGLWSLLVGEVGRQTASTIDAVAAELVDAMSGVG